jgi:hypothetical protein
MSTPWVKPEDLDVDRITVQDTPDATYPRLKILYEYSPGDIRDLVVTVPRDPDAYITCKGVRREKWNNIETNKYGARLILNGENRHHQALYNVFGSIVKKIEELSNMSMSFPCKDMENYSIVYTTLISSNEGKVFSQAYNDSEQLNILECKQCIVRPSLLFSAFCKSQKEGKIRVQISQMYIHKQVESFALANID